MSSIFYHLRRCVAIVLGLSLTGYSAWASWSFHHDLLGPLAATSAAALLAFCEYAWRDRHYIHFGLLGVLGIVAAAISGSVVLERVSHAQEARLQNTRSSNLPRQEAQKALAEAQQALAKAEAEATAECRSGRKLRCEGTESREKEARQRVTEARTKLIGLGAQSTVDPAGAILGGWAGTFRLTTLLGLPLWLELAAPVVLAFGFAPGPRKRPEPRTKAKRRKQKRRKPRNSAHAKVVDWAREYRQRNGRDPRIPEAQSAFPGIARTTAWRRIRGS